MAYNNNYGYQRNSGYKKSSNSGYKKSYSGGGSNYRSKPKKKRSGASAVYNDKKELVSVSGWNMSTSNGYRRFYCTSYEAKNSKTQVHKSKTGREWENWVCVMTTKDGVQHTMSCLVDLASGKVTVKRIGFVLNPRAANGGYCGTYKKRN